MWLPHNLVMSPRAKSLQDFRVHFALQKETEILKVASRALWNLAGSSVHGILQARILEWVAISSSRGSS